MISDDEYKKVLESDLIILENALLNYPEKAKKIKPLIAYLNKNLARLENVK